ncbi:MAG: C_GCAxxG_C_C family protein [Bacteroidales bacterium]|nr:C_GCAxxG_C_C family protein [Bacteroidales bacterium]
MEEIKNKAIESFRADMNCSQSVLTAFAGSLNLDRETAMAVASGFGAGMGRLQGTCGAVTGAYMVFGFHNSRIYPDNSESKEHTYAMIQEFDRRFREKHQTTDCRTLLDCDLRTDEGQEEVKLNHLTEKVCEVCIADAVKIVLDLTGKK